MKSSASLLQIAAGLALLAKALLLPIPIPPNTSLTRPMAADFTSWTYREQVQHWRGEAAAFEAKYPEGERDRFGLYSATLRNLRWAWVLLIGSSLLGLALIGNAARARSPKSG
jgi:hypothetical protein